MDKNKKCEIKVAELFAGVGGFRIGLEAASDAFKTIWNNQWEPSTKHQDGIFSISSKIREQWAYK